MKKTLIFIGLICSFIKPVSAKTYYGDYGDFTSYSELEQKSNDVTLVETKKLYHAYKEKIDYQYVEDQLHKETGDYPNIYSNWVKDKDLLDINYQIEQCNAYTYQPFKKLKYFYLKNLDRNLHVNHIFAFNTKTDEVLIDNANFDMYTNDMFIFYIDKDYNLGDLEINISIKKQENAKANLALYMNNDSDPFSKKIFVNSLIDDSSETNTTFFVHNFYDVEELYLNTTNTVYCDSEINGKIIDNYLAYRNNYLLKRQEFTTKIYEDLYLSEETEEFKIDYEDYKTYYRYRVRDKVVIKDDLIIDDKNINLKDFILESTVDNIDITSNLNPNINGTYNINFILPFKTVSTTVKVDIKDNYLYALKQQEQYIDYLLDAAKSATYSVDEKNLEIKENIISSTKEINLLKEEINNYKLKIKELEERKSFDEEKTLRKQSINFPIILVCLTIIFVMDKFVEKRLLKK